MLFLAVTGQLELQDIATLGAIIGGLIAIGNIAVGWMDRLYQRKTGDKEAKEAQEQSRACQIDHSNLAQVLLQQNATTQEMVKALRDHIHTSEIRHIIVLQKIKDVRGAIGQRIPTHPAGDEQESGT